MYSNEELEEPKEGVYLRPDMRESRGGAGVLFPRALSVFLLTGRRKESYRR